MHVLAEPIRVLDTDFPDPCLVQTYDGYYAFSTNGDGINVRIASSDDFKSWDLLTGVDALPGPFPSWVGSDPAVWAPDVIQRVSRDIYYNIVVYIHAKCIILVGRDVRLVFRGYGRE